MTMKKVYKRNELESITPFIVSIPEERSYNLFKFAQSVGVYEDENGERFPLYFLGYNIIAYIGENAYGDYLDFIADINLCDDECAEILADDKGDKAERINNVLYNEFPLGIHVEHETLEIFRCLCAPHHKSAIMRMMSKTTRDRKGDTILTKCIEDYANMHDEFYHLTYEYIDWRWLTDLFCYSGLFKAE